MMGLRGSQFSVFLDLDPQRVYLLYNPANRPFLVSLDVRLPRRMAAEWRRFVSLERAGNFIKHRGKLTKHLHIVLIIRYRGCQTIVLCSSEEIDRCDAFEWANFGRRFHWDLPVFMT
jgi:hypothetical protein